MGALMWVHPGGDDDGVGGSRLGLGFWMVWPWWGGLHDNNDDEIIIVSAIVVSAVDMTMGVFLYMQRR